MCVCDNMQKMQCASGSRLYQSPLAAKSGVPEISQSFLIVRRQRGVGGLVFTVASKYTLTKPAEQ